MDGHAVWVDKCTKHIHDIDEWSVERLHKKIFHSISGWHTNLHKNKRRTLKTFNNSDGKVAAREVADKYEEDLFYEEGAHILGFLNLFKRIEDGPGKSESD